MRQILIILLFLIQGVFATEMVWITVESGNALYFSPAASEWVPIVQKEKVSVKTYILIKENTVASVVNNSDVYELPSDAYIFIDDIFSRDRIELVQALTQIEAEQLPKSEKKGPDNKKSFGLIYGNPIVPDSTRAEQQIPYQKEREHAIAWFLERGQYSAALLTLKRIVTKYPHMYFNQNYSNQLFALYNQFKLYGFLFEESQMLLHVNNAELQEFADRWHTLAKNNLLDR